MKLTILVALLFSSSVYAAETIGKIVGQIGMAEGEVLVDNKEIKKNSPVREGSVVEVKKGKATLLLGTGSVFHLSSNSKMIVKQFGMRPDTNKEGGDIDLRFGRTRALILNKGSETKDVRIITRTATMGVRGTEIYIDAGKQGDITPVNFFTLEGKAVVNAHIPQAPTVEVKQNTGVGVGAASASGAPPAGSNANGTTAATMTVADVKNEIKNGGMQIAAIHTPGDMTRASGEYSHDPSLSIPAPHFDPLQDIQHPISITPSWCNAASGICH